MFTLLDHPVVLLVVTFAFLWISTGLGAKLQRKRGSLDASGRADFAVVLGASLTLLSLLVGFSFSMASSRYDQRKSFEEDEANAIGTAYARADLLASADAIKVHQLLRDYNALRIRFYTTADAAQLRALDLETRRTQSQMWDAVAAAARASPTPVLALSAATSMNDAINSQGFAQAAAWNRIPRGAWLLLYALSAVATAMIGFRFRMRARHSPLMLILPGIIATALFLIADIDCPFHGVIRITPENLLALAPTLD